MDVTTSVEIDRPRAEVAAFAGDPDNAPAWYVNIKLVEWKTARPVAIGSKVAFVATFLGRRLAYIYEFTELVPNQRLVMRTAEGPFPMETTYEWQELPGGRTRMRLRNRGLPTGFSRLLTPFLKAAAARANRKDLARLKALLEAR
ncbi:MAG TPA: SRPBCC family protein [Polyangia bacterium]